MKKLSLNKEIISNITNDEMNLLKGGINNNLMVKNTAGTVAFSGGCTDGCTSIPTINTHFNCTKTNCSADCTQGCSANCPDTWDQSRETVCCTTTVCQ